MDDEQLETGAEEESGESEQEELAKKLLDLVKEREHEFDSWKSGWWKDAEKATKLFWAMAILVGTLQVLSALRTRLAGSVRFR